jgi:hypothetical protein
MEAISMEIYPVCVYIDTDFTTQWSFEYKKGRLAYATRGRHHG